ncbi:MAG: hypothetical protein JJE35_03225 [Thermoleophilia bacterium]|nr:hypothetical protein [Thermoleophilia bacterium]
MAFSWRSPLAVELLSGRGELDGFRHLVCFHIAIVQKITSTLAGLAAIILFIAVAASSKATFVVLGVYGNFVIFLGAPAFFFALSRRDKFAGMPISKFHRRMGAIYLAFGILSSIITFAFNPGDELSSGNLTSFNLPQALGLFALLVTGSAAAVLSLEFRRRSRRDCPFCLSSIPRQASRCKYCTSEVSPAPITVERVIRRPAPFEARRANEREVGGPLPPWPSRREYQ